MDGLKEVRFGFSKIVTDEFAVTEEPFEPGSETNMSLTLNFGLNPPEQLVAMKVKCTFYQRDKPVLLIAVSCLFKIISEDWKRMYDEKSNILTLPHLPAMHFASLTVSTARGVLHGKTENFPVNALIIPPINLNEFIKGDLVMNPASQLQPEHE
jgi:hypothetical protein